MFEGVSPELLGCRRPRNSPEGTVFFQTALGIFHSCSDNQNHEFFLPAVWIYPPANWFYLPAEWLNPLCIADIANTSSHTM